MAHVETLSTDTPWCEVRTDAGDWRAADAGALVGMLHHLHLIRAFEEHVLELVGENLVHGPAHSSIGQEGAAVGCISALGAGDRVNGTHRAHHHFLAKALRHVEPAGFDARRDDLAPPMQDVLQRTLAEIMGLEQGWCGGRGGSMHLRWREAGIIGTNAIVGGGVPIATGVAWSRKRAGKGEVVASFFGDGALHQGAVAESFNLAALWDLPILFFIDNNQYAVSTTIAESTRETRLSARGLAYGIPAFRCDGMDPLAVRIASEKALALLRAGRGPAIVEAGSYRYFHQNGPLPGSAFGYRGKDEEAEWRARDPLDRMARELVALGHLDDAAVARLRGEARTAMERAAEALLEPEGNRRRIRPALWPDPRAVDRGVRGDLSELAGARHEELETFSGAVEEKRFVDVVARTMGRRMEADERIFVIGEDVHRLRGGTNGATRGLAGRFPDRVVGTPITENGFAGLAGGVAADGRYRPVVEFMYADFCFVAADQVFNQIAKMRHMFGGDMPVPIVVRGKVAAGSGYGSQHSMDPTGLYALFPGFRIVAPSTPFDYVGLMNAALACDDPVLVVEHLDLYTVKGPAPAEDCRLRHPVRQRESGAPGPPLHRGHVAVDGVGVRRRRRTQWAWMPRLSTCARSTAPGFDWETISASVEKTNNLLIVEQGTQGTSWGGPLARRSAAPPVRPSRPARKARDRRRSRPRNLPRPRQSRQRRPRRHRQGLRRHDGRHGNAAGGARLT